MAKTIHIDKYARDAEHWRTRAAIAYQAARILFTHENALMLCFEAAPVAHHALEMFLKTALINEGYTIFNPDKAGQLDPSVKLDKTGCAWAHDLVDLAKLLAAKRPEFDLSAELIVPCYVPIWGPLTIESAFAMFDPFFFELRYPGELEELDGIGPDDVRVLDALVEVLAPFVGSMTATAKPPSPETTSQAQSSEQRDSAR